MNVPGVVPECPARNKSGSADASARRCGIMLAIGLLVLSAKTAGCCLVVSGGTLLVGVGIGAVALARPAMLAGLNRILFVMVSRALRLIAAAGCGVVFYGWVTVIAVAARLVGKRFLDRGGRKREGTYWQARRPGADTDTRTNSERQF